MIRLLLLLLLVPQFSFAISVSDFNPISHWTLDETSSVRYDSFVTNNNDLTDNNTVLYGIGALSNAADFEDTNSEYLNITDASQNNLDLPNDKSFSLWVKPETTVTSGNGMAMLYKWSASQAQYGLIYVDVSGTKKIRFIGYSACAGTNYNYEWTQTLSTTTFTHIVLRYDAVGHPSGNGSADLWVNGEHKGTVTNTSYAGGSDCTGSFAISSLGGGIQWYWDGLIDEVSVFDNFISTSTVTSLYNSGVPLPYTAATTSSSTTSMSTTTVLATDNIVFSLAVIVFLLTFIFTGFVFNTFRKK